MLSEQGSRLFATYTHILYYLKCLPLKKNFETSGIKVCSKRMYVIFVLCNMFSPFHLFYNFINIMVELSKSNVNSRTIFLSAIFVLGNICEFFVFTTLLTKRHRIVKNLDDMMTVTTYWEGT